VLVSGKLQCVSPDLHTTACNLPLFPKHSPLHVHLPRPNNNIWDLLDSIWKSCSSCTTQNWRQELLNVLTVIKKYGPIHSGANNARRYSPLHEPFPIFGHFFCSSFDDHRNFFAPEVSGSPNNSARPLVSISG
jgi:hypothetical protein